MKKAFMNGYTGGMYTMGFLYGYFKKGIDMKYDIKDMLSKDNVRYAFRVYKSEIKLFLESL